MNPRRFLRFMIPLLFLLVLYAAFAVSGHAMSADATWPSAPGISTVSDGKMYIDNSNMAQGYVMICVAAPNGHAFKLRISAQNGAQLMYDINPSGMLEAFPLQLGSGAYKFEMFENVTGNKYSAEGQTTLSVQLYDEDAAFLVPNQYVSYEQYTEAVQKSDQLCGNAGQADAYKAITSFMVSEFQYDFVRAKTISSGTLPDIDYCYSNRMGICQDLAAVTCCMLRVQGVPARLMIGYADSYYHAWITARVNGENIFFDPTAAMGALNAKTYKTERYY